MTLGERETAREVYRRCAIEHAREMPDLPALDSSEGLPFSGFWIGWCRALKVLYMYQAQSTMEEQLELYQLIRPCARRELIAGAWLGYTQCVGNYSLLPVPFLNQLW